MRDATYALLCAVLVGIGNISLFAGYDIQSYIVESVLHSVNDREPELIGAFDGFYGQAVSCIANCFTNLIISSLFVYFRPKWILFLSAVLFTFYFWSFFYLNRVLYFISCAALGAGVTAWRSGYAGYVLEYSTRKTLTQNQSITWSISCLSYAASGIVFTVITILTLRDGGTEAASAFRVYSDSDVRWFYGAFGACACASAFVFVVLPNHALPGSIAAEKNASGKQETLLQSLTNMARCMVDPRMLWLSPYYFYQGTFFPFFVSIYPTTTQFTKSLASNRFLPSIYVISVSAGIVLMGFVSTFLNRRLANGYNLGVILRVYVTIQTLIYVIVLLSVPNRSMHTPNDDAALLIQPQTWLCAVMGVLFGIGDHTNNMGVTMITTTLMPERNNHAFATARFFQGMAGGILFFVSPLMSTYLYVAIMGTLMLVSSALFWKSIRGVDIERKQEKQLSIDASNMAKVGDHQGDDGQVKRSERKAWT